MKAAPFLVFSVVFWGLAFQSQMSGRLWAGLNTFSGEVPASCSFDNLAGQVDFSYDPSNALTATTEFSVTANISSIRLSLGTVTVNNEPANILTGSKPYALLTDPDNSNVALTQPAYKASEGPSVRVVNITPNVAKNIRLTTQVVTEGQNNGRYFLNRGDYSYTVVVNCLNGL